MQNPAHKNWILVLIFLCLGGAFYRLCTYTPAGTPTIDVGYGGSSPTFLITALVILLASKFAPTYYNGLHKFIGDTCGDIWKRLFPPSQNKK